MAGEQTDWTGRKRVSGLTAADLNQRQHMGARGVFGRVLCYSFGPWFYPSEPDVEVHRIDTTTTTARLAELVEQPYAYFFEPTPYPAVGGYDPITMAQRLREAARQVPALSVAFISHPSPVPFEAQAAFAAQVGLVLGSMPELCHVKTPDRPKPTMRKTKTEVKTGPDVVADWAGSLDAAIRSGEAHDRISVMTQNLVSLYLAPSRGAAKFNPTQRRLLHRASTGELGIIAEDVAADLNVQLVTAQRAIRGIAVALFVNNSGRRAPELVGQLVTQYGCFFRHNEA